MIEMESKYGVPTVAVHVKVFARLVDSVARAKGMPRARQAFVPVPMFNQPPAVLRGYVEGDDPVHGGPFMERVFDLLTRPLADEDLRGSGCDRSTPRLVEPDTEENLHELFRDNHWTDYLPIVLPTEERVEAMLAGTSQSPDEVVGKTAPDDRHGVLGVHGREGGGERGDGGRRAGALPGAARPGLDRATRDARAACPRWGTWSS